MEQHRIRHAAAMLALVVLAAVSLMACTGRRTEARPAATTVTTGAPTSTTPPSTAASTDDVEAQLGAVSSDLDAARSDLGDGATQSTTDARG